MDELDEQIIQKRKRLLNIKKAINSLIEEKYIIKDSIEYDSKELFITQEVF